MYLIYVELNVFDCWFIMIWVWMRAF